MEGFESLRLLTPKQIEKCETICNLLYELKKQNVFPLIVDGGGGSGLEFIRCNKTDFNDIADVLLSGNFSLIKEINECIYTPENSNKVNVEYLVP